MSAVITEPGIYDGMPDDVYRRDPVPAGSLSSSGAKKLLLDCPARFRYDTDHPPESKKHFDVGHAAHKVVLGTGPEIAVVDAPDWRTKAAKEARAEAYARGAVPVLTHEWAQVQEMAAALRAHPMASALLNPDRGKAEQSMFWVDESLGEPLWRRARLDWLRDAGPGQMVIPDYKTAASVAPSALERTIANYGYYMQAAWYIDTVRALGLAADDCLFALIFQEKTAPYLVTAVQVDPGDIALGRERNAAALERWRDCRTTGIWPGYADETKCLQLTMPSWAHYIGEYE